jgi:hypothetical protein
MMPTVESTIIGALDPVGLVELNVRLPAKTAKAFNGMRRI